MIEAGGELMARLRALAPEQRAAVLAAAAEDEIRAFDEHWPLWAHKGQIPDHDDWSVWVMLTGRGFGKTRAGAEWLSEKARHNPEARMALVAANPREARRVMIEGKSGLLAVARHGDERQGIKWEPGIGRLRFASGAEAYVYSGADGDSPRGGEHDYAWCDELAKWRQAQETWDNLMLTMRSGPRPQVLVTTTPKPVAALRSVLESPELVLTAGTSYDNPHNATAFIRWAEKVHGGSRLRRQELLGELLEDLEGSLWPRALIEASRCGTAERETLRRVVIGVDPPATADGDECGIVACGLGRDGIARVLGDHSQGGLSPEQWARKVAGAVEAWSADRVIAEGNQGGEMVEAVLRGAGLRMNVKRVHARDGKDRRAEPIAAYFESGEAKLAGDFPALEDQLAGLVVGGSWKGKGRSPDRADAMIWAMTELLLAPRRAQPRITLL